MSRKVHWVFREQQDRRSSNYTAMPELRLCMVPKRPAAERNRFPSC